MWFDPTTLAKLGQNPVATSATSATSSSTSKVPIPKVAKVAKVATTTDQSIVDGRMEKVISKLHRDPSLRYAMEVNDDEDLEALILTLAIRGKGACELRIPKSRYDAFALLELIDRHTTRETLQ